MEEPEDTESSGKGHALDMTRCALLTSPMLRFPAQDCVLQHSTLDAGGTQVASCLPEAIGQLTVAREGVSLPPAVLQKKGPHPSTLMQANLIKIGGHKGNKNKEGRDVGRELAGKMLVSGIARRVREGNGVNAMAEHCATLSKREDDYSRKLDC